MPTNEFGRKHLLGEIYMKIKKTIIIYFLSTIAVFAFDRIYALFGHGVTSHWMANAYLYLFGFGVCAFSLIKIFFPKIEQYQGFSLLYAAYNSGVAILINGMLLLGIIEIAGGASAYAIYFIYIGYAAILAAAILFFYLVLRDSLVRE